MNLDTAQIAELVGCTRAHVTARLTKQPRFPAPTVNLSQKMRRWDADEVKAYLAGGKR
jgi:predicted DNA-binding transcriptional regulator AlpA